MPSSSRIIVALDFADPRIALDLVERLNPQACRLKVGFELFVTAGPAFVGDLVERGFDVFLDLKFHDIPNTVGAVCKVAAQLGVWMINVHASGGAAMMRAAREALEGASQRPLLIAVTVLTSLDTADLKQIGFGKPASEQALTLAALARESALDGVVCSAVEAKLMRERFGGDLVLVTPGIRPAQGEQGDQKRVMTPEEAVRAGSDYLVMGRPITGAADPVAALAAINTELARLT